jgi:hypothetical protein
LRRFVDRFSGSPSLGGEECGEIQTKEHFETNPVEIRRDEIIAGRFRFVRFGS